MPRTRKGLLIRKRKREALRLQLFIRQFGKCCWCGTSMSLMLMHSKGNAPIYATFEHMKKKEHGGTFYHTNIRLAHGKCNHSRHGVGFDRVVLWMQARAAILARELEFIVEEKPKSGRKIKYKTKAERTGQSQDPSPYD